MRALLEYDWDRVGSAGKDWRRQLDIQRAAVIAAELKHNQAQMCRWVGAAVLGSVNRFKLAFCSRISPRDRTRHALLSVYDLEPHEFAHQMRMDLANGFGIVKALSRRFLDVLQGDGRLIVMRDPQKAILRIYQA